MNPGELRHKVTLQYPSGGIYVEGATVWASIQPLRVKELFQAQTVYSECTILVKIRYIKNISAQWKIKHGESTYEVIGIIDPYMRHRELQLMCKVVDV